MRTEEKVRILLTSYPATKARLDRMNADRTLREWQEDYRTRKASGGVRGASLRETAKIKSPVSIQEKLLIEQEGVCQRIQRVRSKVELTKFLLYHLTEDEENLIRMKFFEQNSIYKICSEMYISKSSLYRKLNRILQKLGVIYEDFFLACGECTFVNDVRPK